MIGRLRLHPAGTVSLVLAFLSPSLASAASGLGFYPGGAPVLLVQSDLKIVAASGSTDREALLARYHPDGSLDSSFDEDGIARVFMDIADTPEIALQSDGKIVATGPTWEDMLVWRYLPDGNLDSSFGAGGIVRTDLVPWPEEASQDVAIQPDGKIVVVGWVGDSVAVLRYLGDGSLDVTFDADGIVTTPGAEFMRRQKVAVQDDGKILVASSRDINGSTPFPALRRYNPDGSLDSSFDGDGIVTVDNPYGFRDLALQADGRIIGLSATGQLARFHTDGSVDAGFDGDALTGLDFRNFSGLAVQGDGQILVGSGRVADPSQFTVHGLLADGTRDETFGSSGAYVLSSGGEAYVSAIATVGDGTAVAAGLLQVLPGQVRGLAIAWFDGNGAPLGSFDGDGTVVESDCRRVPLSTPGCIEARRASMSIQYKGEGEPGRLTWKWTGDEKGLEYASLGNLWLGTTKFSLCIYDSFASQPELVSWELFHESWASRPPARWVTDISYWISSPHGRQSATLSAYGATRYPSASVKIADPILTRFPIPRPVDFQRYFEQDSEVIVQMVSSDGLCMVSRFGADDTKVNDGGRFSARRH